MMDEAYKNGSSGNYEHHEIVRDDPWTPAPKRCPTHAVVVPASTVHHKVSPSRYDPVKPPVRPTIWDKLIRWKRDKVRAWRKRAK